MRINLIGSCCFIADRKTENVCGLPANAKKFLETLAGLPQTPKSFSRHLRDSRKRQKVSRDTCGTPANAKKFFETLAGLPQTPKSFSRHLRESRKYFGEPVGHYSMLSMTFSIRESHPFVEFTLYNTDIKPYRANLYVKRTPYRSYIPSSPRKKEYPDRSAPRQNAGKSDQTLRIINHLRARSNSAFREAWRPVGRVDISISLRPIKKMIIKNEG